MRKVNIRELHEKTGATVDLAAEGHVVLITRRGVPVAEMRPPTRPCTLRSLPDRRELLARFPEVATDSGRFLEEERS